MTKDYGTSAYALEIVVFTKAPLLTLAAADELGIVPALSYTIYVSSH